MGLSFAYLKLSSEQVLRCIKWKHIFLPGKQTCVLLWTTLMPEKSVSISCQWSGQWAHPRHPRNHTSRQRRWERSMSLMGGSAAVSLIAAFLHLSWQGECGQASWLGSKWDRSRVCGMTSKASTWLWPSGANKKVSLTISSPRLPAGPRRGGC